MYVVKRKRNENRTEIEVRRVWRDTDYVYMLPNNQIIMGIIASFM